MVISPFPSFLEITPFSPSDVAGLKLWLKPETLDVLADGDPISTWADSSGNGYDATQSSTRRPTKQTASGFSVARFDGSNDALVNSTMTAIGTGDYTLYVVTSIGNNNTVFTIGNGAGSNVLVSRVSGNLYINPLGSGTNVTDGAITVSTLVLLRVYEASGTAYAQRYGATEASGALTTNTNAGYVVGDYSAASAQQPISGDIYEIILYDSNIASGDKTSVQDYLATKYGL